MMFKMGRMLIHPFVCLIRFLSPAEALRCKPELRVLAYERQNNEKQTKNNWRRLPPSTTDYVYAQQNVALRSCRVAFSQGLLCTDKKSA